MERKNEIFTNNVAKKNTPPKYFLLLKHHKYFLNISKKYLFIKQENQINIFIDKNQIYKKYIFNNILLKRLYKGLKDFMIKSLFKKKLIYFYTYT